MKSRLLKYVSVVVIFVIVFLSTGFGLGYVEGTHVIQANHQFFQARENMSITNEFQYNFTLKQYFQYNVTVPGHGNVDMVVMNQPDSIFPNNFTNISKVFGQNIGTNTNIYPPLLSLVFLNTGHSTLSSLVVSIRDFKVYNIGTNETSMNAFVSKISLSNEVKSIPDSGPSLAIYPSFYQNVRMNTMPAGKYYASITLEFYQDTLGIPFPLKSFTFSVYYLDLSYS